MKRRVIQIAESTQLVSLPRKWAKKYNIKKGDELEVEIEGSSVRITTDNVIEVTKKALQIGIDAAYAGNTVGDIGYAIESFIHSQKGGQHSIIPFTRHLLEIVVGEG